VLIAAIVVMLMGFNAPTETQKEVTSLNYELVSDFAQEAYGPKTKTTTPTNLVYFTQIIDKVAGTYTYTFQAPADATEVKTKAQITATVSSQNLWHKETVLVPNQDKAGSFTVDFPLDLNSFKALAEKINQELGIKSSAINVELRADVQVEAVTPSGTLRDSFTQTCEFSVSELTLTWQPPFSQYYKGYQDGIAYEQQGNFAYTISLKPNSLYTAGTLKSPAPEAPGVLRKIAVASSYNSENINRMDVIFTYIMTADGAVDNLDHQIEINGVLSNLDGPQADFSFLPLQHYDKDVTKTLSVDTDLIYDMIMKLEGVADRKDIGTSYQLTVTAKMRTTAKVGSKTIDKSATNTIPITFTSGSVVWPTKTSTSLADTIKEVESVPNKTRSAVITTGYALLGFAIAALLWAGWTYYEYRTRKQPLSPQWAAAQQLMAKHKDIITDVVNLPAPKEGDKVVVLSSLAELIKLSDALLKPVLHQAGSGIHLYAVIDGTTRYECFLDEENKKS
jgi:hypothetical protein